MSMYFENDPNIKSIQKKVSIHINDLILPMYTDNGVFSKDKLDYGTRLLLNNLPLSNMKGNVLDLGCGYGPVGIYLSKKTNCQIDMVDINERAINLAKKNIELNKINNTFVFTSNIYDNINNEYNYIITNPPIRAGKEVVRKFLLGAKEYLLDKGELWFVMRKYHGVISMMKELEPIFTTEIIEKDKGFYIIRCVKNN